MRHDGSRVDVGTHGNGNVHVVSAIGNLNPAVSSMYLLYRITEELKKIQTLTRVSDPYLCHDIASITYET